MDSKLDVSNWKSLKKKDQYFFVHRRLWMITPMPVSRVICLYRVEAEQMHP